MEQVTDIDGNTYKIVKIGKQIWMAENLNVSHFRNGDSILEAKISKEWEEIGKKGNPAWCYFENDEKNGEIYGKLYNWFAIDDPRILAPKGWHVPTDDEWEILINYLGGKTFAGGLLKESGTAYWNSPNTGATNKVGFTALSAGHRDINGSFCSFGSNAYWWSVTDYDLCASCYLLFYGTYGIQSTNRYKQDGYSVRCIKD